MPTKLPRDRGLYTQHSCRTTGIDKSDPEIQAADIVTLNQWFASIDPFTQDASQQDVRMRIAKELRHRSRFSDQMGLLS
jgi:hypothetical protein